MRLFLCDVPESERDPLFDRSLFVVARTPSKAAILYRKSEMWTEWCPEPKPNHIRVFTLPGIQGGEPRTLAWHKDVVESIVQT
jgi:hypothetical protein